MSGRTIKIQIRHFKAAKSARAPSPRRRIRATMRLVVFRQATPLNKPRIFRSNVMAGLDPAIQQENRNIRVFLDGRLGGRP